MALLHKIQESITQEGADLGSVLLQLRFLASRLGSNILEEWVRHESEGYPPDVEVPFYRIVGVSYKGTFFGPFNAQIQNAPIPGKLIQKYAGDSWIKHQMRESITTVSAMAQKTHDGGHYGIDASNLILLLQNKIYEGYSCNSIDASISPLAPIEIIQAVRSRVLELKIELENKMPASAQVEFGAQNELNLQPEKMQQVFQQIIYGNVANAVVASPHSQNSVSIIKGDARSVSAYLTDAGILKTDSDEFAEILASEQPESASEPFGARAKKWVLEKIAQAPGVTWRLSFAIATSVLSQAAAKYYGLG